MSSAVSACAAPIQVGIAVLASSLPASAQSYVITPDETRVVFLADQNSDFVLELYSVPIDGSQAPVMLAFTGSSLTCCQRVTVTPDSSTVVFFGSGKRVFGVPIDGSAVPFQYPFPPPGASQGDTNPFFEISPAGSRVLFYNESVSLHSAPIDGSSSVLLSGAAPNASNGLMTPDAARVVFRSNEMSPGFVLPRLFVSALDGSTGPTPLRGAITSGLVDFIQLSPDGSTVAYTADQDSPTVVELYRVPSNASAPPIKLSPPLVAGGDVNFFAISPGSERVVYLAEQDVDGVIEIYSVPLDGSGTAVKLNGPMVTGGDVSQQFRISPDARLVLYLADEQTDGVVELFGRPIDGAGAVVRLSRALVPGGNVVAHEISPDSHRAVFRADKNVNEVFELFSVWIGRRSTTGKHARHFPPQLLVKLNGPLITGGDVLDSKISPNAAWVVYRADQDVNDRIELYSVPIEGGSTIKLNHALAPTGDVFGFELGGGRVVYSSSDGIFSVPIDGSSAPVELTF